MGQTRRVWTRQVPQVLDEIDRTGRYVVRDEYVRIKNDSIADYYLELYHWLTDGCRRRGLARIPEGATLPVWLSVTESQRLGAVEGTVSLTLDVPTEDLLVLDYDKWGYRVNHWYLPRDREDEASFDEEMRRLGISSEASLITTEKGNFYPAQRSRIVRSWERLFEDGPNADDEHNVGIAWEIRREWVVGVERYDGE